AARDARFFPARYRTITVCDASYGYETHGPRCRSPYTDRRRAIARRRGHAQAHGPGAAVLTARAQSRQRGAEAPARPAAAPPVRAARRTQRPQPAPVVRGDGRRPGHSTSPDRAGRGGHIQAAVPAARSPPPAGPLAPRAPAPRVIAGRARLSGL